eukprot:311812_1
MAQYLGFNRIASAINVHKLSTMFIHIWCVIYFNRLESFNSVIHSACYCLFATQWILTTHTNRAGLYQEKVPISQGVITFVFLSVHHYLPAFYINYFGIDASPLMVSISMMVCMGGMWLVSNADAQKHYTLINKKGLIMTDLWSLSRNINYFGELLVYVGLTLFTKNIVFVIIYNAFMVLTWTTFIGKKEKSLSRYKEWKEYSENTAKIIPFVW